MEEDSEACAILYVAAKKTLRTAERRSSHHQNRPVFKDFGGSGFFPGRRSRVFQQAIYHLSVRSV
jgi:hypothetical protein